LEGQTVAIGESSFQVFDAEHCSAVNVAAVLTIRDLI
jgi:hypothetical protein